MTDAMDFIDPANRLAVLEQVTAEGMLSLKKETVRGNEYSLPLTVSFFRDSIPSAVTCSKTARRLAGSIKSIASVMITFL